MASRGQMLHVMVQLPNKQEVELKLPEKSPVTDIFALAEAQSNPPTRFDPKNCQLFWNGSRLGNNMFLDYYRIPHKAKLVVSRRLKSSSTTSGGDGPSSQRAMSANRNPHHQQQQPVYDQYGNPLPQGFDNNNNQHQHSHQNSHNNSRGPSNVGSRNTSTLRQSRPASGRQSMNTSFESRAPRAAPNANNRPTSPNNNWGNGPDRDGFNINNNNGGGYPPHPSSGGGPNHPSGNHQHQYAGSTINTAPAADAHPSALHSYRVRELEVQLARSHEQYRVAQDRIAELEASVQRLSLVAKRSLELQQQQASSQFPSVSAAAGLEALRNEYSYETGYMGSGGGANPNLKSPPHPSSPNRGGGAGGMVGSPHSVASTVAPYNTHNYTAGGGGGGGYVPPPTSSHHNNNNMHTAPAPPPGAYNDATQQGMQRQLEELRESYRRQSPQQQGASVRGGGAL